MLDSLSRIESLERRLDRWLPEESVDPDLPDDLEHYIPALSAQFAAPVHLSEYIHVLRRTLEAEQRVVLSVPPRHAKTETTLHAFPWFWEQQPEKTNCYVTYAESLAESKSRRIQHLAMDAGYSVSGKLSEWHTQQGRLLATGVGGPLTGHGIDGLLVIDDPIKNRKDAESAAIRNRVHDWARDVAFTRLEPGSSCIVIQTRWHVDDLAGRLAKEGWPVINIPAVANDTITGRSEDAILMGDGSALWPERWPMAALQRKRKEVGEFTWASLYQGRPIPRGQSLFGDPTYFSTLPTTGYRIVHGVDLAYTSKTHADWSLCVTLYIVGKGSSAVYYVADVQRAQCEAPQFMTILERQQAAHKGPMWWHCSGTEKGSSQFMRRRLPQLRAITASTDKFTRALPASEAWNDGRILVPERAPWLQPFLECVQAFTGVGDPNDDDVDALGSAFAAGQVSSGGMKRGTSGVKRRF
jgi:predicted phage terminase large subunit-like protein